MSTVLVAGGTGALGRHVVSRLQERGDDLRVLSRRPGAGTQVGDLNTGAGVAEAARGAELVIHAASDFRRFGRTELEQTEQLIAAAQDARHLRYVSIVGIDSIAPLPLDFRFQTVAAAEAGERAAELSWRTRRGWPRRVIRLPIPGEIGRAFREGRNTCPDQTEGHQTWVEFLDSGPANPYSLR